jgi:hypothetical protein
LLRNFVDAEALARAYDMTLKAYARVDCYYIHPDHLRQLGMPMYSNILFCDRHFDLLSAVFGDRDYEISSETSARCVGRVRAPPHWLPPLGPHLNAFVHPPRAARALRDHRHSPGPFVAYAQRHGVGTLTWHLRRVFIVASKSRANGGVGVL